MSIDYDKLAEKYDSVRAAHHDIQYILNRYICFKPDRHIHIDLGCGTCRETFILGDKVNNFVGIDLSARMLEIAKQRINGIFTPILSDLQTSLPLLHSTADSVTIISFYHHIINKPLFFAEVNRIMSESATLVLMTNTIEQLKKRGYYDFFETAISIQKDRFLDKDRLESMLIENNFSIVESKQICRPISIYGEELLSKIQTPAFDSIFNLIDKTDFNEGIKKLESYIKRSKKQISSCRDGYLIVCAKGE